MSRWRVAGGCIKRPAVSLTLQKVGKINIKEISKSIIGTGKPVLRCCCRRESIDWQLSILVQFEKNLKFMFADDGVPRRTNVYRRLACQLLPLSAVPQIEIDATLNKAQNLRIVIPAAGLNEER